MINVEIKDTIQKNNTILSNIKNIRYIDILDNANNKGWRRVTAVYQEESGDLVIHIDDY